MLFFKRKDKKKQPLVLEKLVVRGLWWSVAEGKMGYELELEFTPVAERVAVSLNKEVKVRRLEGDGLRKWSSRTMTERDLYWAQVNAVVLTFDSKHVGRKVKLRGEVEGSPEDFTLSRLGIRFGRVLLKDELLWHPVIGLNLVSWGMVGRVNEFYVEAVPEKGQEVLGPGEREEVEGGVVVFKGRPSMRMPGVSLVAGFMSVTEKDGVEVFLRSGSPVTTSAALSAVDLANSLWSRATDLLGVPGGRYERVAAVWDDVDPFAAYNFVVLRESVVKAVPSRHPKAVYEVAYTVSNHLLAETYLTIMADYWLYESLSHATALLLLYELGALHAVRDAVEMFRACIDENVGSLEKLPPLMSLTGPPKTTKSKVLVYCKAPLTLWGIAASYGAESLASVLSCIVKKRGYSLEVLRECLSEVVGSEKAERYVESYIKGRALPEKLHVG